MSTRKCTRRVVAREPLREARSAIDPSPAATKTSTYKKIEARAQRRSCSGVTANTNMGTASSPAVRSKELRLPG